MMKYFKLFANCIVVRGYKRSVIVDLQRINVHFIPNDLDEILTKCKSVKIEDIYVEYGEENIEIIKDYFINLENLDLGFFCEEIELDYFPDLKLDYKSPFAINNAVIENFNLKKDYSDTIGQLENLGCEYLELVFYNLIDNNDLISFLDSFYYSSIKYIGLIIKDDITINNDFLKNITSTKLRLTKIIIHTSEREELLDFEEFNLTNIIYTQKKITEFKFCGNVDEKYFTSNVSHFTESQHYNSCLNKKIAIDKDGNIKNCPAISQSFGNIKNTTLEEALQHKDFKKYWNITKDQIDICKDCEFRHICTDCRAYIEDPENQYSKPLKCGYDPYTNQWEEWSTNPLKQKAIQYYGMQELISKTD